MVEHQWRRVSFARWPLRCQSSQRVAGKIAFAKNPSAWVGEFWRLLDAPNSHVVLLRHQQVFRSHHSICSVVNLPACTSTLAATVGQVEALSVLPKSCGRRAIWFRYQGRRALTGNAACQGPICGPLKEEERGFLSVMPYSHTNLRKGRPNQSFVAGGFDWTRHTRLPMNRGGSVRAWRYTLRSPRQGTTLAG